MLSHPALAAGMGRIRAAHTGLSAAGR